MRKFMIFFGGIWAIVGTVFVIMGIGLFFNHQEFMETALPVEVTITDITSRRSGDNIVHDVFVSYFVDGQQIESKLNFYDSSMRIGKELDVYYDPLNLSHLESGSSFMNLLPALIGSIFAVIGYLILFSQIKSIFKEKSLLRNGRKIEAVITDYNIQDNIRINGRHPYVIICQSADGRIFESNGVLFNPSELIGHVINVYIDLSNSGKYVVDVKNID